MDPIDIAATRQVRLEHFETLVYGRRHAESMQEMLMILRRLKAGGDIAGHVLDGATRPVLYSRLAAAMAALISDPQFQPTQTEFDKIAIERSSLSAIFSNSVFESSDYLLNAFSNSVTDSKQGAVDHARNLKFLLSYSLDSRFEVDMTSLFQQSPRVALPLYLGLLAQPVPLSEKESARRNRLLAQSHFFDGVAIEEHLVDAIGEAYFICSYADFPAKHEVKRTLNGILRRFIDARISAARIPIRSQDKVRPTVMVATERFTSTHAVYRCVAPYIRALREKFRLVAIGPEGEFDSVSGALFDSVIGLPGDQVSFPDLLAHVNATAPDIILYPSVGMSPWCVAMSTLRLAPIQLTSIGHPATTHCPEIDYALIPEAMAGEPHCFSEAVILFEGCLSVVDRTDASFPRAEVRTSPQVVNIAVPAAAMKLTPSFMASCRSILEKCGRRVQFHFFPHLLGMGHHWIGNQIRQWIPDACVHQAAAYNEYLLKLAQCDVLLSSFPFGGMNSNIDSMKLGIPMVTLEGPETHSRTDSGMMRAAGLPEWLIAHEAAEFEAAAIRLIGDDAERVKIANALLSLDIGAVFSDRESHRNVRDFLAALWFVYTRHEAIGTSGRRYWTVSDRKAISL